MEERKKMKRKWFAMKVFNNKALEIEKIFQGWGIETYIPIQWEEKVVKGEKKKIRKPAISSLIFLKLEEEKIDDIEKKLYPRANLYRYRQSKNPAVIPEREMAVFKMITSTEESKWDFVDIGSMKFSTNDKVRVTGGYFEGAEGYIKRIKGNRRLVVAIEGIVAIATAYIPSCYLEKLTVNN
jgi:transcription antitermination factor NusG